MLEFRLEPGRLIPPHAHRRQLEDVNTFVLREARRRSAQSAQMMVRAVRALLRFLYVQGVIAAPLAAAVPSLARRS